MTSSYPLKYTTPVLQCAAMLFAVIFSIQAEAAPPEGYNFLSYGEAITKAAKENKPVFLYLGRYGCSTCRKMHKEVFSDIEIQKRFNSHYILAYVDTESGNRITLPNGERITEMQFATRSRILGTPTFIFKTQDETQLLNLAGFKSIEKMKQYDEYINGGHYKTTNFKAFKAAQ
ncbi:MAG: thioredoxin fold domain-containing protein [Sedimenticola sp.]